MKTEEDRRECRASPTNGNTMLETSLNLTINDTQVREDEIERLRQRVEDLELTVVEYRNQMTRIVTSVSWKFTKPIRSSAARMRETTFKATRVAGKLKNRGNRGDDHRVLTAGLFMPNLIQEVNPGFRLSKLSDTKRRALVR